MKCEGKYCIWFGYIHAMCVHVQICIHMCMYAMYKYVCMHCVYIYMYVYLSGIYICGYTYACICINT